MKIPSYKELNLPSEEGYAKLLDLQYELNSALRSVFDSHREDGRVALAKILVSKVDKLIDEVNAKHYELMPDEYSGDTDYEHSEQTFSNSKIVVQFVGFSAQVSMDPWER